MSMTKNYIGDLQDKAGGGDIEAIATLSAVGLWESVEEHLARVEWEAANAGDDSDDNAEETTNDEWDEEFTGDDDGEPFDDVFADGEALASAGLGTDEDYGCYGGEDF